MKLAKIGDSYFVEWSDAGVILEFRRIKDHRDDLSADFQVSTSAGGDSVYWTRMNIAAAGGRQNVVRALTDGYPGVPWRVILDRSCQAVARAFRTPEPSVSLCDIQPVETQWLVDGLVPRGETTVLYGDGGSGKSLLALTLCVAGILGHPIGGPWTVKPVRAALYLDWESDAATHARRLHQLEAWWEPIRKDSIQHKRLFRPLTDDVETIRSDAARYRADLVVCDSLGAASGPEPESGDASIRTMMALRSLEATVLVIAHISKAQADQSRARPFGSVYNQNLPRSTIEVRSADDDPEDTKTVSLYHRKVNDGRLMKPSAVRFVFDGQRIAVTTAAPDVSYSTLSDRIRDFLGREGKQTGTVIAKALNADHDSVTRTLSRMANRDTVIRLVPVSGGKSKETQWGLVDRNRDTA